MTYVLIAIVVLVLIFAKMALVIIPQSETKIIERLGRYYATLRPGINIIIPIVDRAKEIAKELSDNDITQKVQNILQDTKTEKKKVKRYDEVDLGQMSLFDITTDEDIIQELKELDISNLTPLEGLNTLYRLQNKLNNRWKTGME